MKKSIIFLSIAALMMAFPFVSCKQGQGGEDPEVTPKADSTATPKVQYTDKIVFYNIDRLSEEYKLAKELTSALETKVKGIQNEITRKENSLRAEMNSFQQKYEKGLLTRTVAEEQGAKLQKKQTDFQNFALRKQDEIANEQTVTMRNIFDAINTYIQKFNEEHHFAMIIATSSAAQGDLLSVPVTAADPSLDITDLLVKGLNDEYDKAKENPESEDDDTKQ